jgi:uncharacterized protein YkwD
MRVRQIGRTTALSLALVAEALSVGATPPRIMQPEASMRSGILAEINLARMRPLQYAERLRRFRAYFRGKVVHEPGRPRDVETVEGVSAVDEAIAFLEQQSPLPPLAEDERLDDSAIGFAEEAGPAGVFGHIGPSGSTMIDRIREAGVRPRFAGEAIAYGPDTAVAVVRGLIVDDGVADRGHRTTIFSPRYQVAGVGCGPHRQYRIMCVIDFAGSLIQR